MRYGTGRKAMRDELRKTLVATLAETGFPSATAAVAAFPVTMPMVEVGGKLGITAVQLGELLRLETEPHELKHVAARILIGELTRFLGDAGWPSDTSEDAIFPTIRAHIAWRDILGRDLADQSKRVIDRLRQLTPTPGWRPISIDDAYLVQAFEAW